MIVSSLSLIPVRPFLKGVNNGTNESVWRDCSRQISGARRSIFALAKKEVVAELWVESRSAAGSLSGFCESLKIDLVPLAGHTSWAYIFEQSEKIKMRQKNTHIFCLSDWDEAGLIVSRMDRDINGARGIFLRALVDTPKLRNCLDATCTG